MRMVLGKGSLACALRIRRPRIRVLTRSRAAPPLGCRIALCVCCAGTLPQNRRGSARHGVHGPEAGRTDGGGEAGDVNHYTRRCQGCTCGFGLLLLTAKWITPVPPPFFSRLPLPLLLRVQLSARGGEVGFVGFVVDATFQKVLARNSIILVLSLFGLFRFWQNDGRR